MSGFLLDTNIVSELAKPSPEPLVESWLSLQNFSGLYISVLTLGELEKGLVSMADGKKRQRLEAWFETRFVEILAGRSLPVTEAIAKRWGSFDSARQRLGRPLAVPDGIIAATAFEHKLTLVTRNVRDFDALGLDIFNPWIAKSSS